MPRHKHFFRFAGRDPWPQRKPLHRIIMKCECGVAFSVRDDFFTIHRIKHNLRIN